MNLKESFTLKKPSSKRDEDNRRCLKWLSFTKSKVSLGFKHLSPAYIPSMSNEKHAFALCFEKITGLVLTSQVLDEFAHGNYEMVVQLSFSMFHLNSSNFFGATWMGPEVELNSNNKKQVDFKYEDIIYMVSRINDSSCVGVVEIIISKYDRKKNIKVAQFG
jgi:hypothetical protein